MQSNYAFVWPEQKVKAKRGRPRKVPEAPGTTDLKDSEKSDRTDPNQVLSITEVAALLSVSTRTLKRWERSDPEFPKPFPICLRQRNWLYKDVTAYILRKAGKSIS